MITWPLLLLFPLHYQHFKLVVLFSLGSQECYRQCCRFFGKRACQSHLDTLLLMISLVAARRLEKEWEKWSVMRLNVTSALVSVHAVDCKSVHHIWHFTLILVLQDFENEITALSQWILTIVLWVSETKLLVWIGNLQLNCCFYPKHFTICLSFTKSHTDVLPKGHLDMGTGGAGSRTALLSEP